MKHAAGLAALCTAIAFAGAAQGAPAPAGPVRVMSLNSCTDQLLMLLLPPDRISSVTYGAEGAAVTPALAREARTLRVNHGVAEEVLAEKPDLVVAEPYTTPAARKLTKQAGIPLLLVDPAATFEDIRRITRQVAKAVGEEARGEALLHSMDVTLAELERTRPAGRISTIAWDGSGRARGELTLFNAIVEAAGGINLGPRGRFAGSLDLEQLLSMNPQPDLLFYSTSRHDRPSLQTAVVEHPVLAHVYAHRRLAIPEYECGTPLAADQAVALRRKMQRALETKR